MFHTAMMVVSPSTREPHSSASQQSGLTGALPRRGVLRTVAGYLNSPLSATSKFFTIYFTFEVRDAKATKYDAFRAPGYEIEVSVSAQGLKRLPVTISGIPAAAAENTCKTLGRRNTPFARKK